MTTRICYCVKCGETFESPAAFDAHLVRRKGGLAQHDHSHLTRNAKGYFVTAAWGDRAQSAMRDAPRTKRGRP